jgi:putative ABC transport system permease protein
LIACANLTGVILARATARQKETSIRLALGAGRGRLFGQYFTESLLVSLAGGATGWLGAYWLLDALAASIPFDLPSTARLRPDVHVLIFTLAVALGTSLVFSLVPLARLARLDINETLKEGGARSGVSREHSRAQRFLIVGEVAISMALLVVASLLMESLYRMYQQKLGFEPEGVVAVEMSVGRPHRQSGAARWDFERRVLERFEALPGVISVAGVNALPLTGQNNLPTEHVGKPNDSIGRMEYRAVTANYFHILGIPVLRGHGILPSDTRSAPEVAVISESVARQWFPNSNPIGERLQVGRYEDREFPDVEEPPREIAGVVGDVKAYSVTLPPPPTIYVPSAQVGEAIAEGSGSASWVIHAKAASGLAEELRQALAQVDPEERVLDVRTMNEIVRTSVARPRFDSLLMSAFAGLAVLLAGVGIFGVLSYQVSRRGHEIGVRMALGAERGDVLGLVIRQGMALTFAGIGLGLGGAWALARFLSSLLFGVRAHEPAAFAAAAAIMAAVAFLASYLPARRATKVDPMVALRCE